jgi:DNA-binding XRE family transcriptional regulator
MEEGAEVSRGRPKPDAMDAHVGARLRLRRTTLGMSQERLADAVGLTFQQIQKYERGVNRVGASRLWDLARVLDVPIGYFYEGGVAGGSEPAGPAGMMPARPGGAGFAFAAGPQRPFGDDPNREETQDLVRAYYRIIDPTVRRRMLDLIKSLGSEGGG